MRVAVFGSSLLVEGDPHYETAREVGRELARRGATVVCGGYGGVMEAVCRGAAEMGGSSIGVVLADRGAANRWVTETVAVPDLSERLRRFRDLPDAWIFLPRGLGTMLELVWLAESVVKGDARPRPLVLVGDFWKPVLETCLAEASVLSGAGALVSSLRYVWDPVEAVEAALKE